MNIEDKMNIEELFGLSAGKICYSNLRVDGSIKSILDGAEAMWESGRSSWFLVEERMNGGTIWQSPDEGSVASVNGEGKIVIEPIA
jgi:hypothetical protein